MNLDGNIWIFFANYFKPFFQGLIADLIEHKTETIINVVAPIIGNEIMLKLNGYFPIPIYSDPGWTIDWETPDAVQIEEDFLAVGIKGLLFDNKTGEIESSVPIPDMPSYNSTLSEGYQAYVSTYTIDSLFGSYIDVNDGITGNLTS